jgi:prepilin-type N-terminal cleavage/methylation domain-containing protein
VEANTMHAVSRSKSRSAQAGFTLAEILVACAIISVGLVAVATGFGVGVDGVEAGRQQSAAVFLAEQRVEQVKEMAVKQANLGAVNHTNLAATEAYTSIPGAARYRRTTRICPGDAGCPALGGAPGVLVTVTVFYQPVTGRGVLTTERQVSLDVYLTPR